MNPRTLLVLTILVAAMAAFIFFYEKDTLSTEERTEQAKKVLVFEQDEVSAVGISWDENEVRLVRQEPEKQEDGEDDDAPAEWRLAAPLAARADRGAVDSLLESLGGLEKERTLEDADRSALGFDEPRARLTLTGAGGERVLEVGAAVPGSTDVLVAVAGEVYQVSDSLWTDLTREPGDWRDKKLFTASRAEIDRLTLSSGGTQSSGESQVLLAPRGDDFWIESPLADLADEDLVNSLMTEVTGLSVEAFLDDPEASPAELGLEPAGGVLEVVLAGRDEPFRIELGTVKEAAAEGASPTVHARCEGQLVEVKTRLADALARPAPEWRSRDWTSVQVFQIETAFFEDAEGPVEVIREGSDWLRGEDRIGYSAASDVLYAMTDAKAERVVSREVAQGLGHSLAEPALTITLETEDSSQSLTLYPAVEELSAATREGREAVLLLSSAAVGELESKLAALRAAEPLPEEEEEDGGDGEETE